MMAPAAVHPHADLFLDLPAALRAVAHRANLRNLTLLSLLAFDGAVIYALRGGVFWLPALGLFGLGCIATWMATIRGGRGGWIAVTGRLLAIVGTVTALMVAYVLLFVLLGSRPIS